MVVVALAVAVVVAAAAQVLVLAELKQDKRRSNLTKPRSDQVGSHALTTTCVKLYYFIHIILF